MTLSERVDDWRRQDKITPDQHQVISALVRRDRFSVYSELNALLYAGILSFVGGLGWTVQKYFASLGDPAILTALTLTLVVCLTYCFRKGAPFAWAAVESPTFTFDYILYFACLVYTVELGYLEFRWHILAARWDTYLLVTSLLMFFLAYRFDNRLVLSLAISSLGGWFGVKVSQLTLDRDAFRMYALLYGVVLMVAGTALSMKGLKEHFRDMYFHIAFNVLLIASLSGIRTSAETLWLAVVLSLAAGAAVYGIRTRRFLFVVYGVMYGYIGFSMKILSHGHLHTPFIQMYFIVTGLAVVTGLIVLARRFGDEA